uniref:G-protein coupled receptors family 1 profile domain-containing protein n=1 Tax=Plectus sambesii TaxID=2011161 RepID=A0A914W8Q7_9BILA
MVIWYFLSVAFNLPLMLNDAWGEDPAGFCGAKKFTSIPLMISYEFSIIVVFYGALTITAIYYYRLVAWLKQQEASVNSNSYNKDAVDFTSGVVRVMKIVTLFPLCTMTPAGVLTAGQTFLPEMPMWINRLLLVPYYLPSAANPWLTIGLIKIYRVRFLQVVSHAKNIIPRTVDKLKNRARIVPKISNAAVLGAINIREERLFEI